MAEATFAAGDFANNTLARLRAHMADKRLDACITTNPIHVAYLSGAYPPKNRSVAVLVTQDSATLVTTQSPDVLPATMVCRIYEDNSIDYVVDPVANFARAFDEAVALLTGRVRRLGLEPAYMAHTQWEAIRRSFNLNDVQDVNAVLRAMRMVKGAAEVALIEACEAVSDSMYAAIEKQIHAGASELDVYITCLRVVKAQAANPAELDGDFVSGPRTDAVGGPPTQRRLALGDLLITDLFPRLGTHNADTCRTYVVGTPSQLLVDRHGLLQEAISEGEKAIKPGLPTKELYAVVRGVFERARMAEFFPHHAGHGVGMVASEEPRIIPGSRETLSEGMVITLEPGLYVPGQGGMRLEDNFLVTASGSRCLTHFPRRLTVL